MACTVAAGKLRRRVNSIRALVGLKPVPSPSLKRQCNTGKKKRERVLPSLSDRAERSDLLRSAKYRHNHRDRTLARIRFQTE